MTVLGEVAALSADERRDCVTSLLEQLTLREVLNLVTHLEARWDVKASPASQHVAPPKTSQEEEESEQTEFDVVLTEVGSQKIVLIKAVRVLLGTDLKAAKDLLETIPARLLQKRSLEDAQNAKKALEEAGATVELR